MASPSSPSYTSPNIDLFVLNASSSLNFWGRVAYLGVVKKSRIGWRGRGSCVAASAWSALTPIGTREQRARCGAQLRVGRTSAPWAGGHRGAPSGAHGEGDGRPSSRTGRPDDMAGQPEGDKLAAGEGGSAPSATPRGRASLPPHTGPGAPPGRRGPGGADGSGRSEVAPALDLSKYAPRGQGTGATGPLRASVRIPRMSATQPMRRLPLNPREACHPIPMMSAAQST
jgi:hypothetical protein